MTVTCRCIKPCEHEPLPTKPRVPAPPGHIYVRFGAEEFTIPSTFYQVLVNAGLAAPFRTTSYMLTGIDVEPEIGPPK